MKIRISTIPRSGLEVTAPLPKDAINQRMNEGRPAEIVFTEDPEACLTLIRNAGGAEARGEVSIRYQQQCGRCLDELPRESKVPVELILKEREEGEEVEDDIGLTYYKDDLVDLEDILQETIILSLSVFWSPPLENGKCSGCDRSPAELGQTDAGPVTSLAGLLKKAGVN